MSLGLSGSLSSLVAQRFASAKFTGALVFSHTEVTTISVSKLPFQLRYCPALAKKPVQPQSGTGSVNNVKRDPFDNPPSDLLIAEVPQHNPTHILVLNKFPVIKNHFILATKQNKPQTDLLEKDDLGMTYSCLKEWESSSSDSGASKRLFAFFNSGEHSGASQPHRHLQFLPVEDMAQLDDGLNWEPLIDKPVHESSSAQSADTPKAHDTPFTCYALDIPREPSSDELHQAYLTLYRAAAATVRDQRTDPPSQGSEQSSQKAGPAAMSYNLAMTTSRMVICPRRSEHAWIQLDKPPGGNIPDEGLVKLNGTILAGTLMVKADSEWSALQKQPMMLDGVLQTVGVPWSAVSASRI